jgi:hypothetical protein
MSEQYVNSYPFNDYPRNPFNPDFHHKSENSKSFQSFSEKCPPPCNLQSIDEAPPGVDAISESQLSTVSFSSSSQKAHRTDMKFSPMEKETYLQLYTTLLNMGGNKDKLSSLSAARLMKSSGLSSEILKAIWLTVVRSDSRQEIRKSEFFACLKLVAIAQKGGAISQEILVKKLTKEELPIFNRFAVKPAVPLGKENNVTVTHKDQPHKIITVSKGGVSPQENTSSTNTLTQRNPIKFENESNISSGEQYKEKVWIKILALKKREKI